MRKSVFFAFAFALSAAGVVAFGCGDDEEGANAEAGGGGDGGSPESSGEGSSSDGGGDGSVKLPAPRWSALLDSDVGYTSHIAVGADGVFVAGASTSTSPYEWIVEKRSLADGALVPSFGIGGIVRIALPGQIAGPPQIVVDGADIYLAYGYESSFFGTPGSRLEKRSAATGAPLWTKTILCLDGLAVDDIAVFVGCHNYYERRAKSDGAGTAGFGDGGVVFEQPNLQYSRALGFFVEQDSLFVYGQIATGTGNLYQRLVERRDRQTGARKWSVGADPAGSITGGASDGTSVYLAGEDLGPWLLEKRDFGDGGPVAPFGAGGRVTGDSLESSLLSLSVRGGVTYLASGVSFTGGAEWWVQARDTTAGAPVVTFGDGGVLRVHPGDHVLNSKVIDMKTDDETIFLLGSLSADGGKLYRLERRDRASGAL